MNEELPDAKMNALRARGDAILVTLLALNRMMVTATDQLRDGTKMVITLLEQVSEVDQQSGLANTKHGSVIQKIRDTVPRYRDMSDEEIMKEFGLE